MGRGLQKLISHYLTSLNTLKALKIMSHNTLIILGMHRSGTSLLSNWLHHCGLNLGERLLGSGLGNIRGHYEDIDFIELHDEILKQVEITDGGLTNINKTSSFQENNVSNKIRKLVQSKQEHGIDWGWKDPRTCLFLPYYEKLLPKAKIIAIYRPPLEVVDSLLRRKEAKLSKRFAKRLNGNNLIKRKYYKFRMFVFSKYLRSFKAKEYLRTWTAYNELIIDFLSKKNDADYILISLKKLEEHETRILRTINSWGFSLKTEPLNNINDRSIMSNSTAIVDLPTLTQAKVIESKLEEMSSF